MNPHRPGPSLTAWVNAAQTTAPAPDALHPRQFGSAEYASHQYGAYEQRLVTGDAVALALYPTSWLMRCLSGGIDLFIMLVSFTVCMIGLSRLPASLTSGTALQQIAVTLTLVMSFIGYPVVLETITRGRTVGKYIIGARVVRLDGGPITFRHAFARALVGLVDKVITLGSLAVITCVISPRTQRVGDMAAGTLVVNTRVRKLLPVQYRVPPHLEEWIQQADIRPLEHHIATRATQLVQRWDQLNAASRAHIETDLVRDLSQLVSPPPPLHADTRDICAAIIGERQRRDMESLRSTMARRDVRRAIARGQEF